MSDAYFEQVLAANAALKHGVTHPDTHISEVMSAAKKVNPEMRSSGLFSSSYNTTLKDLQQMDALLAQADDLYPRISLHAKLGHKMRANDGEIIFPPMQESDVATFNELLKNTKGTNSFENAEPMQVSAKQGKEQLRAEFACEEHRQLIKKAAGAVGEELQKSMITYTKDLDSASRGQDPSPGNCVATDKWGGQRGGGREV